MGTIEKLDCRGFGKLEQKNKFSVGEQIEVMKPDGHNLVASVRGIWNEDGKSQESAPHARQILYIDLEMDKNWQLEEFDILRRKEG